MHCLTRGKYFMRTIFDRVRLSCDYLFHYRIIVSSITHFLHSHDGFCQLVILIFRSTLYWILLMLCFKDKNLSTSHGNFSEQLTYQSYFIILFFLNHAKFYEFFSFASFPSWSIPPWIFIQKKRFSKQTLHNSNEQLN